MEIFILTLKKTQYCISNVTVNKQSFQYSCKNNSFLNLHFMEHCYANKVFNLFHTGKVTRVFNIFVETAKHCKMIKAIKNC